ncbi:MAG TPA: DUF3035 domain-containing protein [Rhizomicrobium sp.]
MQVRSRKILLLALMMAGVSLSACESVREAAGIAKEPPDEFAVVRKGALIMPPDYNLRPPKSGAAPLNQATPTDTAQSTLFGSDPNSIAATITGNYSPGEKLLLANAGAANADPSIRQQIASDSKQMEGADSSFTNQVLFGAETEKDSGVDADAEVKRIIQSKEAGSAPGNSEPVRPPTDSATIDKNGEDKSSGGWFDGWFDWL